MKINYLEEFAMPHRNRTVAPEVSDFLARLDGGSVIEVEEVTDPLYPQAPAVRYEHPESISITVPRMLLGLTCPDCNGVRDRTSPDPLALHHLDERCEVYAQEQATERRDIQVLNRLVSRGHEARKHRLQTRTERLLLAEYVLVPPTYFTTTWLTSEGRRARGWSGLRHEPALATD